MDWQFWLGLAVSIPLSIFANWATPHVLNYLARWSAKAEERRNRRAIKGYQEAKRFYENKMDYLLHLQFTMFKLIFLGGFAAMFVLLGVSFKTWFAPLLGMNTPALEKSVSAFGGTTMLMGMAFCLMFVQLCGEVINLHARLKEFGEYEADLRASIGAELLVAMAAETSTTEPEPT